MEDSKNHILQTALSLFLEKSYKAVTFQELVDKTGFSKGAFFHYFKNKLEIFEAVIDMYLDHIAAFYFTQLPQTSLRDFLDGYLSAVKKMQTGFLQPEAGHAANRYALMFEALRILPDFKDKITRNEDKVKASWVRIIAIAKKHKEIKTVLPDEQLAQLFIDIGHGRVIQFITSDSKTAVEKEILGAWNNLYRLIKV